MIERCGNCLDYYNKGYSEGRAQTERFDTILTAEEIKEMVATDSYLEGHWYVEIHVPYATNPFMGDRAWIDSVNTLVESCGVKIISLKFKLKMNVASYQFALREG
jgi:hypothetical protein